MTLNLFFVALANLLSKSCEAMVEFGARMCFPNELAFQHDRRPKQTGVMSRVWLPRNILDFESRETRAMPIFHDSGGGSKLSRGEMEGVATIDNDDALHDSALHDDTLHSRRHSSRLRHPTDKASSISRYIYSARCGDLRYASPSPGTDEFMTHYNR
jgi:hypothetical protein